MTLFEVIPLLHSSSLICTDGGGSKTLRNVTTLLPKCTPSYLHKTTLYIVIADNLNCQKNAKGLLVVYNLQMYSLPLIGFVLKFLTEISNFNRRNHVICNFILPRTFQSTQQPFIIKVVPVCLQFHTCFSHKPLSCENYTVCI